MADQWYYAQNGQRQGPVSQDQLKELAVSGQLNPSDTVWKEGMVQWVKAGQVSGLFPAPDPARPPAIPPKDPSEVMHGFVSSFSPAKFVTGRPMVAVGLVLVLLARGCDQLAKRGVDSATAHAKVAQAQFDDPWDKQVSDDQRKIDTLQEKENPSPEDTKAIEAARASLKDVEKARQKALRTFQATTLRDVNIAARDAESAYLMGAYWRELLFILGGIVLVLGLLMVSWVAEGTERWVSLTLLAIITLSLFVSNVSVGWLAR